MLGKVKEQLEWVWKGRHGERLWGYGQKLIHLSGQEIVI